MSEVEALLCADAGDVPPGVTVFRFRDPEAPTRRLFAMMAISVLALAIGCGLTGAGRTPVMLLLLAAGMLGVWAWPAEVEPASKRHKRPMLVVTQTGMIVRDAHGLRTWQFANLADVSPFIFEGRVGLLVVERNGRRDFVDHLLFQRGEDLREIIGRHLNQAAT